MLLHELRDRMATTPMRRDEPDLIEAQAVLGGALGAEVPHISIEAGGQAVEELLCEARHSVVRRVSGDDAGEPRRLSEVSRQAGPDCDREYVSAQKRAGRDA